MESLWRKQTELPAVQTDIAQEVRMPLQREVIVIGAGMAGLLTAYFLKEQGKDVLVLEAAKIASGQTERTTAKITSQHGLKYSTLIRKIGFQKAKLYAEANEAAILQYEQLIHSHGIECQFERIPAFLYSRQSDKQLRKEAEAAAAVGIDAYFTEELKLPFPVAGAVCFRNQAQFSPLEFVRYISGKLEILEDTKVIKIRGHKVITEDKEWTAEHIIVAAHYPFRNIPGFYFLRQHQERSYVLALSGCEKIHGMYYGIDRDGLSLRQAGEVLLLGGGSCRTGENKSGGAYAALSQAAEQYFPGSREITRWAAQDCMTHDGIPFIGRYSVFTPDLYVITGFQKWGMTSSMIAAMLLRDKLCGIKNPYEKVFSPQRINIRASTGNLLTDISVSARGLLKGLFGRKELRCPHMGCKLSWNADEESWDCPCHGSRFDADGNLLDNPAMSEKY